MPLNNEHLFLISPELGDQFCHAPRVAAITRLETWIAACRVYVTSAHCPHARGSRSNVTQYQASVSSVSGDKYLNLVLMARSSMGATATPRRAREPAAATEQKPAG